MIPNKSNFKFQELTPITGVKPYVIRFWETEFPEISPMASDSGQKIYERKDVEAILKVKKLLFEDKLSIPEAKLKLSLDEIETTCNDDYLSEVKMRLKSSLEFISKIKAFRNW